MTGFLLLLGMAAPDNASYQAGYVTGQIIFCLALLALALKCFSLMRRPAANAKCALSLGILLLAIFGGGVCGITARHFFGNPVVPVLVVLVLLAIFAAILASFVLAIVGLVEYADQKGRYTQGRTQAVLTLVLCGLFGVVMVIGTIDNFQKARLAAEASKTPQLAAEQWLSFNDLNFKFKAPDRPWTRMDAKKVNKNSTLAFLQTRPDVFFMVIAEKFNPDAAIDNEQLAEICKANLRSAATSSRVLSENPVRRAGLAGIQIETEGKLGNNQFFYRNWVTVTNGYAYQLVSWGRLEDTEAVRRKSQEMFSRFELIDYTARTADPASKDFHSTNFQYTANLRGSGWRPSAIIAKSVPAAEFAAYNPGEEAGFYIVPITLMDQKPSEEALIQALLGMLNVPYPSDKISNRKKIGEGNLEGMEFDYGPTGPAEKIFYRIKMLKNLSFAYLVVAYYASNGRNSDKALEEALARVVFPPAPALPLEPIAYTSRDKDRNAQAFNQIGLSYYKAKQFEKSAVYFKDACEFDPTNSIYELNVINAFNNLGKRQEALEQLENHPRLLADNQQLRAAQAFLQLQLQQTDKALTNFGALFADGYQSDDYFTEYVNLLSQTRQQDEALEAVEKYLKEKDSPAIRLLEARLYKQKKNFTKAIDLLKTEREKFPFNTEVALSLADAYQQAGRYQESGEICRRLIDDQIDSAYVFYLKGSSEFGLKRYREAKVSFEEALKKSPNSTEVKSYLDLVSGMLGEGNNTALKEPIAPVAIPENLMNSAAPEPPESYARDFGARYLKQIAAISYVKKKEFKRTDYLLIKVLDSSGISAFSTVQFGFDPISEGIFVNELKVKDANGKILSTGNISDYYVVDNSSSALASQRKILNIPVSGLQPGCVIELTVTRQDLGPPDEFPFTVYNFSTSFPVLQSALFIRGEVDSLKFQATAGINPEKTAAGICWMREQPVVYNWEPFQQALSEFLPTVWVGDGAASWEAQAKKYLESIRDHLQLEPSQRQIATKLAPDSGREMDRISAVANYVQSNYTYKAIEFGRRARIPHQTAEIVHNQYGDCKDHALLLQQMLEASGIPCRLALIKTAGTLQKTLPSLDQFDHMVVYVPSHENGFFIDCTDKGSVLGQTVPLGLARKEALILDEKNPRFVSIPDYAPGSSAISSQREVRLTNQADVVVHETLSLKGYAAAMLRSYLKTMQPAARRSFFYGQLSRQAAEITELKIGNLEDTGSPLTVQIDYLLKRQFHVLGNQITGKIPNLWEHYYLSMDPVEHRATPFEIAFPLAFQSTINVATPAGYRDPDPQIFEQGLSEPFTTCKSAAHKQQRGIQIEFNLQRQSGRFAASNYSSFRESVDKALDNLDQEVSFTKASR